MAIPAYNCAPQIGRVLSGFDEKLLDRLSEVIVIDDRGKDDTGAAALVALEQLPFEHSKIKVVRNNVNLGLGGSHKMAFLYGQKMVADYVAILHGDDQAKAPELNMLLDAAEADPEVGAVLGSRFMKGSTLRGYAWERIWGNRVFNLMYTVLTGRRTLDLGSGLNLFRLKDLADNRFLGFDDRMTFNFDLLLDYYTKHTKLRYVPITWTEEDQVTNARNVAVGRRAMGQLLKWRFGQLNFAPEPAEKYTSSPYKNEVSA